MQIKRSGVFGERFRGNVTEKTREEKGYYMNKSLDFMGHEGYQQILRASDGGPAVWDRNSWRTRQVWMGKDLTVNDKT